MPAKLEVREKTIGEVLESYRSHTDRPVVIHWSALADIGLHREEPIGIDSGPLAVSVVFEILAERTRGIDAIERFEGSEAIEVGPRSLFDRRTISRRNYELSGVKIPGLDFEGASWQRAETAVSSMMYAIRNHVSRDDWTDHGGDLATMSPVGTSIVVSAPERMHDAIEAMLADLHEQGLAAEAARDQAESDRRRAELRVHDELIDRLKDEYARASTAYLEAMSDLTRLRRERSELTVQPAQQAKDEDDLGPHLDRIDAEIRSLELQAEEHGARMRYLRSRLIGSEYEHLFSEMPSSHQPPVALPPQAMRLEGAVRRPGDFEIPVDGINLRRFIAAAGGLADSRSIQNGRIHIQRDGTLFATVKVEDLSGEGGLIELRAGDRVVVSAPGQN